LKNKRFSHMCWASRSAFSYSAKGTYRWFFHHRGCYAFDWGWYSFAYCM